MIYELIEYDYGVEDEFTLGFFNTLEKAKKAKEIAEKYYEDKGVILVVIREKNINILQGDYYEDLGPITIK